MFEELSAPHPGTTASGCRVATAAAGACPVGLGAATLAGWVRQLADTDRAVGDWERIEQIRVLEELKSAAAAAQAVATADLMASQRARQELAGTPRQDLGRGVAAQVALARRRRIEGIATSAWPMPWCTRCRERWPP